MPIACLKRPLGVMPTDHCTGRSLSADSQLCLLNSGISLHWRRVGWLGTKQNEKSCGQLECAFDPRTSGPRFNTKMTSYQYRKSHCGDKTIWRPSYLHNGISYTGKTTSLYWIGALEQTPMSEHLQQVKVNTLRPRENGSHFADDILKCIFLNENVWIPIEISLKFVPKGPIDNIPALV